MQFTKYLCTKTSINCLMSQNHAHRPLLTRHLTPLPFFSGMRVTILILGRGGFATHSSLVTQLVSTVILGGLGGTWTTQSSLDLPASTLVGLGPPSIACVGDIPRFREGQTIFHHHPVHQKMDGK